MGYNKFIYTNWYMKLYCEGGFEGNFIKLIRWFSSKVCTYRPSLSPQGGISRNKVGVLESVPRKYRLELDKAFYLH